MALDDVPSGGVANFSAALATGFELLQRYNRSGLGCQCNQAIMLVTNGPPSSFPELFKQYNWPHHPVRVFTYLVGRDASNGRDMSEMACSNKGFYARIKSPSDAAAAVLHYTEVLARPMVMYQHDHPIHWTPIYTGGRANTLQGSSKGDDQLMTSVSTPVFDRRNYSVCFVLNIKKVLCRFVFKERTAKLLGVVGTDVPILQIQKLVPQYRVSLSINSK